MSSSQGTSGAVFSTVVVVCRFWHAISESSVVFLDSMDLPKLCDVIYKDVPFIIYLLNYSKINVVQINSKKTQQYFSPFFCLGFERQDVLTPNIAAVKTFLV